MIITTIVFIFTPKPPDIPQYTPSNLLISALFLSKEISDIQNIRMIKKRANAFDSSKIC